MTDQWILSDDKENCPERAIISARWKELIDRPVNWLEIVAIDYLTDFDGQEPGAGGIIEIGKDEN